MDFQEIVQNKVSAMRAEQLKTMPVITLGELIAKLEPIPQEYKWSYNNSVTPVEVRYDFPGMYPTYLDSWRGIYAELALGYGGEKKNLADLLKDCKEAVGKTFEGYKGGEFVMGKATPIWVSNYGESQSMGIVDVINEGHTVILVTMYMPH